jgi:hypothetical protein
MRGRGPIQTSLKAMPFPNSFLLLQQEGYLIRTSLAQGLTLLRSANLGETGHYYGAFFGLSIALERLLKVIIILDHMATRPDSQSL